jgi:hypothetical protein
MRSMKQAVVALVAGGLLVAGGTAAGIVLTQGTSRADNVASCLANLGSGSECNLQDQTVPDPSDIYAQLTSPTGSTSLNVSLTWTVNCPTTGTAQTGSQIATVPSVVYLASGVNISSSESCLVTINVQVVNFSSSTENVVMWLDFDEGTGTGASASATPTPTPSVPSGGVSGKIKGFDSKCVDDSGNSSSNRAEVISESCNGSKAQTWRYASGELIHNNLCLDDKGNAGNGGKLILYTCSGGSGEIWVHQMNNTYELKVNNWKQCLTIPGSSKKNGIQLQADTCHNSADQHWNVP